MALDTHRPDHEELAALYALDALEGEERSAFEAHLAECDRCRRAVEEHLGEVAALAELIEPIAPLPETRAALLEGIGAGAAGTAPPRPPATPITAPSAGASPGASPAPSPWSRALPLAAALAIVGLLAGFFLGRLVERGAAESAAADRLEAVTELRQAQVQALEAELADTRRNLDQLRGQVEQVRTALAAAAAPQAPQLAGLEAAPRASGRIFLDGEAGRALFVARNLPALEEGRTYQLWGIEGGTPRSLGTFAVDAQGAAQLILESFPGETIELFAVTEEPAGGVPQPTGAMVLKS